MPSAFTQVDIWLLILVGPSGTRLFPLTFRTAALATTRVGFIYYLNF